MALKLRRDGKLQVNVPFNTRASIIEEFITAKYSWIVAKQQQKPEQIQPTHYRYCEGEKHLYLAKEYTLKLIIAKQSKVELKNDELLVFYRENTSIKNLINKWYRLQAIDYLQHRTQLFAESYQFPRINKIKIRSMKARWGSCSTKSVITYNLHLIKASPENIDYVIIHELCHLIHPNHGPGFYQLQQKLNPNWKQQKQLLNARGYRLLPY